MSAGLTLLSGNADDEGPRPFVKGVRKHMWTMAGFPWKRPICRIRVVIAGAIVFSCALLALDGRAVAEPDNPPAPPLPVVTPSPTAWAPKFPYPYDKMQKDVTDADITAEREMCEWFNQQYDELIRQIDRFNVDLISNKGRWDTLGIQERVDAVTANIDQSVDFLAPRAQALTISQDFADDLYFPLYQGESFYRLWQQLSNVGAGIRGRQPAWFYGPSLQHARHWGSRINRSHVCR